MGPKSGAQKSIPVSLFPFWIAATIAGLAKMGPLSQARLRRGSGQGQVCSPTPQVEAATAQVQRRKWKLLMSRFRRRIVCFTVGISTLAHLLPHVNLRRLLLSPAQARLRSAHLFTHHGAVKTHLTRNRQLLTRARKGVPPHQPGVPNL
jgi:hypothetical protein